MNDARSHAARLESSERLRTLLSALQDAAIRAADGADAMTSPAGSLKRARALVEVIRLGREIQKETTR